MHLILSYGTGALLAAAGVGTLIWVLLVVLIVLVILAVVRRV